ncbi:MAG: sensor histidine kinase [Bacteroidetes bacterium]|nr:sensor histidine kinase [Bacteroidota bacterium]
MNRRRYIVVLMAFVSIFSSAQETTEGTIKELSTLINESEGGAKLQWLDSLSSFIAAETKFESDSIANATVDLALTLDSLEIATWHTSLLIYYQNNRKGNAAEGRKIFDSFLKKASGTRDHKALAKFFIEGGDSYYFLRQYPDAITYYSKAENEAKKGNHKRYEGIAKLYKGGTLSFMGAFAEASIVLQDAARIFHEEKDTFNIMSAQNTLSILYSQNSFFKEAKKERDVAIDLAVAKGSNGHLLSMYYNAATDARKKGNRDEEIDNLKKAISANAKVESPDVYIPNLYGSLIIAYSKMDSISLAKIWIDKLEAHPDKYTEGQARIPYIKSLKHYYFAKNNYKTALQYGEEHLINALEGSQYEDIQNAQKFLATTYDHLGNERLAYRHFKAYYAIKDSINDVQKIHALSYYQTLYETEKRDAKILAQRSDIELLDAKNEIRGQWMLFGGLGLAAIFGLIILIRSKNAAHQRRLLQERFSQDLILAQEEERKRVARELHDSVGQKLMLLTKKTREKDDADMTSLANGTLGELRSIARGLHPSTLDKLGFTGAVEAMINELDSHSNIFFTHEIENIDEDLSRESALHLYRIIQEVLTNMVKHSKAKSASIVLERDVNSIKTAIKDNGQGFVLAEKINQATSLGMKTLMERAKIIKSKISITSNKNKGTEVVLITPVA